ncbi:hypothetical protein BN59_01285 [Legionella massiliensis]|uniref:Transmembrane protein n=1 Tax=Legionella massiliensis TaxID=1034943 RepID=A0A078KVJ5_9GAMM|nr:hypothetical protein [Legionella massiliensis]CDZ77006.1 hypothetical protein BN59_01285 [Legionella massiliensis]CEE12744.1 hypothetical protein BN1094_01285 [Legionella massiliensis]
MNQDSKHYSPLSPRLAGAVFFAIYAMLFMLFTKYTLISIKDTAVLPLLPSILISLLIGALAGSCLGKTLAKEGRWLRSFLIGIVLALLCLILGSLAILLHSYFKDASFLSHVQSWKDYFVLFGAILLSLTVTIGLWLIPLTGFIAIYFNKHFFPGLMAADKQRMQELAKSDDQK